MPSEELSQVPGGVNGDQCVRAELVACGRKLLSRGLLTQTSGNLSVRIGSLVYITPSSLEYDRIKAEDVAVLNLDGSIASCRAGRSPSSETPLHCMTYEVRPDVSAIVHTHSLYATMFAVANLPIAAHHYAIVDVGHEVPVVPYARFGSEALAQNVLAGLGQARAVLLQNHGAVAVGDSLAAAFRRAETVEWLAHLAWGARLLGPVTTLSPAQLEEVVRGLEEVAARYPDLTAAPSGADA